MNEPRTTVNSISDAPAIKASAGTGKTTTLLKRVLWQILTEQRDDEESVARNILIITFTVAAADDVRSNLRRNIAFALRYMEDVTLRDEGYWIGGDDGPIALRLRNPDLRAANERTLRAALSALPTMQVSTIDAFAKRIVDRNADFLPHCGEDAVGIVPGYELLADASAQSALRRAVFDSLLQEWYRQDHPRHSDLMDLLDEFGGATGDDGLRDEVLALYDVAQAQGTPAAWLDRIPGLYEHRTPLATAKPVMGNVSPFFDRIIADALDRVSSLLADMHALRARATNMRQRYDQAREEAVSRGEIRRNAGLSHSPDPKSNPSFWDHAECWYTRLEDLLRHGGWDEICFTACSMVPDDPKGTKLPKGFPTPMNKPVTRKPNPADILLGVKANDFNKRIGEEELDELKQSSRLLTVRMDDFNAWAKEWLSTNATASWVDQLDAVALQRLEILRDLTMEFARRYDLRKTRDSLAEYADVQRAALQLVSRCEPVAKQVAAQWPYVYVDESQDNSPMQNDFVDALRERAASLTMVGDIKQSIYGFRNASPEGFAAICERSERVEELRPNFRSSPEIIDFVNTVFDRLMDRSIGGADYTAERLELGSKYLNAEISGIRNPEPDSIELLLHSASNNVPSSEDLMEENGDPIAEMTKRSSENQQQVDMVVRRIQRLLRESLPAGANGKSRRIRKSDIMVLARTKANFADLQRRLLEVNIASRVDGVGEYFVKTEIVIALDWLRIIANPLQDVPLVAVMRSIGFTNDQLAAIRLCRPHGHFYLALCQAAKSGDIDAGPATQFLDRLHDLQRYAAWHPIAVTLRYLYVQTGWYDYAGDLPQGSQRQANLNELTRKAEAFEQTRGRGISAFIDAVKAWAESKDDNEEHPALQTDDAVRIMTIHKSKGLQAPVVILMDAAKQKVRTPSKDVLHAMMSSERDRNLGVCSLALKDSGTMLKATTPQYLWMKSLKRNLETSESLRLLYVALTRAESKLIIAGRIKNNILLPREQADPDETDQRPQSPPKGLADRVLENLKYPKNDYAGLVLPDGQRNDLNFVMLILFSLIHAAGGCRTEGLLSDVDQDEHHAILRLIVPTLPKHSHSGIERQERCSVMLYIDALPPVAEFNEHADGDRENEILRVRPTRFLAERASARPRIPSGVTASGAEHWRQGLDEEEDTVNPAYLTGLSKPDFMTGADAAAAPTEIGTAVHAALELYDWTSDLGGAECEKAVDRAFSKLLETGQARETVVEQSRERFRDGVLWFVRDCELAEGIRSHLGTLHREAPFAMLITPAELLHTLDDQNGAEKLGLDVSVDEADTMVVRGIIDGYYVDDAAKTITLFDYKTDVLRSGESTDQWAQRLREDYRSQQRLYAAALERMYGYRVVSCSLVGLAGRSLIDVDIR